MSTKLAVVGSRGFADYQLLQRILDEKSFSAVISGGAVGADTLAAQYVNDHNQNLEDDDPSRIDLVIFTPDWAKYGKAAGVIRNRDIVNSADSLVAFWDGKSKGTENSINLARRRGIDVEVIMFH